MFDRYFLEAFKEDGSIIGGLFAGRGWIWHPHLKYHKEFDYRKTKIYKHLTTQYQKDYPRYERVKFYEIRSPDGDVLETIPNRYYRKRK